jgi:tungstate transport system permease protein
VLDLGHAFVLAAQLILRFDPELMGIIGLSLRVSLTATVLAFLFGAPTGLTMAVGRFPGRQSAVVLTNALLGLPPVVVGLIIYLLLSRSGPLGSLGLLFTPSAMVVAQAVLGVPVVAALTHRSLESLWRDYGDPLTIDGASRTRAGLELLRMSRSALLTAFLAAFGRAISEVGAILVVGGNIRGFTRTMTTTIALETSKGELALALGLGIILVGTSIVVSACAFALGRIGDRS